MAIFHLCIGVTGINAGTYQRSKASNKEKGAAMSRSRKKPYVGNCAESDKDSKRIAHKAERRAVKAALDVDLESVENLHEYQFSDPWHYAKDGKRESNSPAAERK